MTTEIILLSAMSGLLGSAFFHLLNKEPEAPLAVKRKVVKKKQTKRK